MKNLIKNHYKIIGGIIVITITLLLGTLFIVKVFADYKTEIAKKELVIQEKIQEIQKLETPKKRLEEYSNFRIKYVKDIEETEQILKQFNELKYISEMQIRCQRQAMYDEKLNCENESDYKKFLK